MPAMTLTSNAVFTDRNIDVKDAFESLHLGHGSLALCGALVTPVGIGHFGRVWLPATLGRCHLPTVLTIGRKDFVEVGEINARFGHQSGQACQFNAESSGAQHPTAFACYNFLPSTRATTKENISFAVVIFDKSFLKSPSLPE